MKAELLILENADEIDQLENMGLSTSHLEERYDWVEVHFNPKKVDMFCRTDDGNINIIMGKAKHTIKYDVIIWEALKKEMK